MRAAFESFVTLHSRMATNVAFSASHHLSGSEISLSWPSSLQSLIMKITLTTLLVSTFLAVGCTGLAWSCARASYFRGKTSSSSRRPTMSFSSAFFRRRVRAAGSNRGTATSSTALPMVTTPGPLSSSLSEEKHVKTILFVECGEYGACSWVSGLISRIDTHANDCRHFGLIRSHYVRIIGFGADSHGQNATKAAGE